MDAPSSGTCCGHSRSASQQYLRMFTMFVLSGVTCASIGFWSNGARHARLCAQREFVQHYMTCMSSSRTHAIRGQIFERSKKRHCYTLYFSNVSSLIPQIFTRFGMDVWLHETHRWRTRTRCSLAPRNRSCTERPPR